MIRDLRLAPLAVRYMAVAALTTFVSGCGTKEIPKLPVFPVQGKALVDGKAPTRALVTLHPVEDLKEPSHRSFEPCGYVEADGTFHVGSYLENDGAPAGEYIVTLVWPKITIEGGEETIGQDQLGGKFNNPRQPVAKVTIKEGENVIPPFLLTSQGH